MSEEEIQRAQWFEPEDARRAAGLRFVREVAETRAHPSDEALDGAREAGYGDEEILRMVANLALTTFSNYTNDLAGATGGRAGARVGRGLSWASSTEGCLVEVLLAGDLHRPIQAW